MLPELETARLRLRQWREEDLEPYVRLCADPEVTRYLSGGADGSLGREQVAAHMDKFVRHWEERGFGQWAAEDKATGGFVGRIGLMRHDDWPGPDRVEVGWVLARSHWGRGLATEGALVSLRHGFGELGFERIVSITSPDNAASRRVMEKVGLTVRGETRWRGAGVVWYAADREDWENGRRAS